LFAAAATCLGLIIIAVALRQFNERPSPRPPDLTEPRAGHLIDSTARENAISVMTVPPWSREQFGNELAMMLLPERTGALHTDRDAGRDSSG